MILRHKYAIRQKELQVKEIQYPSLEDLKTVRKKSDWNIEEKRDIYNKSKSQ